MIPIKLFCGYDRREKQGFHVFLDSALEHTKAELSIHPLSGSAGGTNAFTYSRFEIPRLCGYSGWAIWADGSDMLCKVGLEELMYLRDETKAVQVVKHSYRTKHPRKYVGTDMEADNLDYERKNWSSLILWNNEHERHADIENFRGVDLHKFSWLPDELIGALPREWNVLVGEEPVPNNAKILHYTLGIPGFAHYRHCDASEPWHEAARTLHSER